MQKSLRYGLFFSIPPGITLGSGFYLMTGQKGIGLAAGFIIGILLFGFVLIGREYGSADERLAEGP